MLPYYQTPVQEIKDHPVCTKAGVRLFVKREDLNHPLVSGNKWWKLKYNLESAMKSPSGTIVTFGGAFSNHIYATAAAAREIGLHSIGIIRGEETLPLNPTLDFAVRQGMKIHYLSRVAYRQRSSPEFTDHLHRQFGEFFLIPEGGSNLLAVKGCAEFAEKYLSSIDFDHLFLAVGTGGTMAGIICAFKGEKNIRGVSVLRGGAFLREDVSRMAEEFSGTSFRNWSILTEYHEGGYARKSPRLLDCIEEMKTSYGLPLDQVYTGKVVMGVLDEIAAGAFGAGSRILVLHTGGLQGTAKG